MQSNLNRNESNHLQVSVETNWIESIGKRLQYHQKVDKLLNRIGDKRL